VILGLRLFERPPGVPFVYDFRLYSLLLLGAVLFVQGVRLLRAATAIAAGTPAARGEAVRTSLIVLGLAAGLIPIQFFGAVLTAGSLVTLAVALLLLPAATTAAAKSTEIPDGDSASPVSPDLRPLRTY